MERKNGKQKDNKDLAGKVAGKTAWKKDKDRAFWRVEGDMEHGAWSMEVVSLLVMRGQPRPFFS